MVFIADEIPRELRRIVEFPNEQMDPAEVLAVEVRQYAGEGLKTLVPKVIGLTAEAEQRKARPARTTEWTAEEFDADLRERVRPDAVDVARRLRGWAADRGLVLDWGRGRTRGTFYANLGHDVGRRQIFGVVTTGKVEVVFKADSRHPPFGDVAMRRQLPSRLNALPDVSIPDERLETWANMPLLALSAPGALEQFFGTWDWYLDEVRPVAP